MQRSGASKGKTNFPAAAAAAQIIKPGRCLFNFYLQIIISLKTTGNLDQNDVFLSVKEGGIWRVVIIMVIVCEMNSNLIHILTLRSLRVNFAIIPGTMGLFTFEGGTRGHVREVTLGSRASLGHYSLLCVCRDSQTPDIVSPGDQGRS